MSDIIHLPGRSRQVPPPERVHLTRDIKPWEALDMIKNQQTKLIQAINFLKESEAEVRKYRERAEKATRIAAQYAARCKKLEEANADFLQQKAEGFAIAHDAENQLVTLSRLVVHFMASHLGYTLDIPAEKIDTKQNIPFSLVKMLKDGKEIYRASIRHGD